MRALTFTLAMLFGCGGSSSTTSLSCDTMSGVANHTCYDQTLDGADLTQAKTTCGQKGGTVVSACSLSGAIGGCKNTVSAFGGSVTTILWKYSGTVSTEMSDCTSAGGTWVTP